MTDWAKSKADRGRRIAAASALAKGKVVAADDAVALLEAVIRPGDRVCLEGDNQKQADVLARALSRVDPTKVHDLHLVQSGVVLPEHLDVFESGIAQRLDFSYSGPQAARLAQMLTAGRIELGAVHTYLELFARYFIDLTPDVALIAAVSADRDGNLYTGPNTEDTPMIVEATSFKAGIVIAQVAEIVERVPRVDIPATRCISWSRPGKPFYVEPLFTRDPAEITETQILIAMLAIKGIYAPYGVKRLNHGIGFNTAADRAAAAHLSATQLGLKGKICTHWALNPHPTLIPAIEAGWVEQVHCFGSEVGMDDYLAARPDVFFTGAGRFAAVQPGVLPDRGPLRLRPVHRLDPADRPGRQQLHLHRRTRGRLRRRAQHGLRSARPPTPERALAEGRGGDLSRHARAAAPRPQARGADRRDLRRTERSAVRRASRRPDAGREAQPAVRRR